MWREMLQGWVDLGKAVGRVAAGCCLVAFVAIATYSMWMGHWS